MKMMSDAGLQPEVGPEVQPQSRPRAVTWVVVLLWIQVAVNVLGGLVVLVLVQEDRDHGRDVPGLVPFLGYLSMLAAVLFAVCAVLLVTRRLGWPRYTVILVEWLLIASWFVGMIVALNAGAGAGAGLPPIIPLIIAIRLTRKEMADWYDDSPHRR